MKELVDTFRWSEEASKGGGRPMYSANLRTGKYILKKILEFGGREVDIKVGD